MARRTHATIREGVIAGMIGAAAVAIWFFVVDLIAGAPFRTPSILGEGFVRIFDRNEPGGSVEEVLLYTLFHLAAFSLLGIVAVALVHASHRTPALMAGILVLFVIFEVGSYFLVLALAVSSPLGGLAWWQVGVANLLAATLMGFRILRDHPRAMHDLTESLEGRTA